MSIYRNVRDVSDSELGYIGGVQHVVADVMSPKPMHIFKLQHQNQPSISFSMHVMRGIFCIVILSYFPQKGFDKYT